MTKNLLLLSALAMPAHSALLAHVETTRGMVTVELQHETAPQAVANFITLAQGSRSRVDPATGAVTDAPLYIGEKFFRTANSATFKFAQTGSGTGNNSGKTGFTFKDEFSTSVRHTGYTLSSANAGPNTNGGQIFFTGSVAIPQYDDVHSIIGMISDPVSRGVIDTIIGAGDNATTITAISFERTDAAAQSFDETNQGLPTVSASTGRLEIGPDVTWIPAPPLMPGDLLVARRSLEIINWNEVFWDSVSYRHVGPGDPPIAAVELGDADSPRAFYHVTLARHPDPTAPSHFKNRTLTVFYETTTTTYSFDATGKAGTVVRDSGGGPSSPAEFTVTDSGSSAYAAFVVARIPSYFPSYHIVKIGVDSTGGPVSEGRQSTDFIEPAIGNFGRTAGMMTLTK